MSKRQRERKHTRKLIEISGSKYANIPTVFFDIPCPRFVPIQMVIDTQYGTVEVIGNGDQRKKDKKALGFRKKKI